MGVFSLFSFSFFVIAGIYMLTSAKIYSPFYRPDVQMFGSFLIKNSFIHTANSLLIICFSWLINFL